MGERLKNKGERWARCNEEAITDTQYRITGLIEGAFYEFRVYAENAAGVSLPSNRSPMIECCIPVIPPGPPCLVRLVDTSKNSATIDWEAPLNDNGSEVTGYVVEKKKFDATDSAEWFIVNETPVKDCKLVVDGLEENQVYELQVKAINAAGLGQPCECNDFIKAVDRSEEPHFILEKDFSSLVTLFSGKSLNLKVNFEGRPKPNITWHRNNNEINSDALITVSKSSSTLLIENVRREDSGKYFITMSNTVGTKVLSVQVNVLDVPGAVGPINYKDIKSESVTLSWNEPEFDGCCELTGYLIEKCDLLQMSWSTVCSDCTRTFYRLDKLVEGKTYKFRVTAFNKYGAGVSRETEESLKITNAPSAPLNLLVEEVTKTTIKLSWEKPEYDGGSRVSSYVVEISKFEEEEWNVSGEINAFDESCKLDEKFVYEINSLVEDCKYDVRVKAVNEIGQGLPSIAVTNIHTKDYTEVPTADVSYYKLVTLKASSKLNVSIPIRGLPKPTVEWSRNDKKIIGKHFKMSSGNYHASLEAADVQRSDSGIYNLKLANSRGTNSYKINVLVLDVPAQPHGRIIFDSIEADNVTIAWQEPLDNGGTNITGYVVHYRPVDQASWSPVTACTAKRRYRVTKLKRQETYYFKVAAENVIGCGKPLMSGKCTVDYSFPVPNKPGKPEISQITKDSARVLWKAPKSGPEVHGYFIEYKKR